jgi:hypothetical protein
MLNKTLLFALLNVLSLVAGTKKNPACGSKKNPCTIGVVSIVYTATPTIVYRETVVYTPPVYTPPAASTKEPQVMTTGYGPADPMPTLPVYSMPPLPPTYSMPPLPPVYSMPSPSCSSSAEPSSTAAPAAPSASPIPSPIPSPVPSPMPSSAPRPAYEVPASPASSSAAAPQSTVPVDGPELSSVRRSYSTSPFVIQFIVGFISLLLL